MVGGRERSGGKGSGWGLWLWCGKDGVGIGLWGTVGLGDRVGNG